MCIRDRGSGVPQGSVLGPLLYLLFTSDLPSARETTVATYADDTAILATHSDPSIASFILQESLNNVQFWLDKWRIKIKSSNSVHVTFNTVSYTHLDVYKRQPVYLHSVINYNEMISNLTTILGSEQYSTKSFDDNTVKSTLLHLILTKKLIHHLKEEKMIYHTY